MCLFQNTILKFTPLDLHPIATPKTPCEPDDLSCPLAADGEREAELEAGAADADRERPAAVRQPSEGEGRLAEPRLHLPPAGHTVAGHVAVAQRAVLDGIVEGFSPKVKSHLFYFLFD